MEGQGNGLPLLQFALEMLFNYREGEQITKQSYENVGGVRGALREHAEHLFNNLSFEQQEATHKLFLHLIALGTTDHNIVTRKRIPYSEGELCWGDEHRQMMQETITIFIEERLITADQVRSRPPTGQLSTQSAPQEEETLEVSHETLLREWPRLTQWIAEEKSRLLFRERLNLDIYAWEIRGRPVERLYRG